MTGGGTRKASGNVLFLYLGAVYRGELNLKKFIKQYNYYFTFLCIKKALNVFKRYNEQKKKRGRRVCHLFICPSAHPFLHPFIHQIIKSELPLVIDIPTSSYISFHEADKHVNTARELYFNMEMFCSRQSFHIYNIE